MSTIKLTNNVVISKNSVEHLPRWINKDNVLVNQEYAETSSILMYTATQPCFVSIATYGSGSMLKRLEYNWYEVSNEGSDIYFKALPYAILNTGQSIRWRTNNTCKLVVFGLT